MAAELTEDQKRTLWLIWMRWAALCAMTVMLSFSFFSRELRLEIVPAALCVAAAVIYNMLFSLVVHRLPPFSSSPIFVYLRMLADITVVTLLVHFTGGVESPFNLFYLLEVASVSIFGLTWLGYFISAHIALFYGLSCWLEAAGVVPHYSVIITPGMLYHDMNYVYYKSISLFVLGLLIVYMTSYLSDRVRDNQKRIEELSVSRLDFMNMAVHELRSPLTTIKEYASLLADGLLGILNEKEKEGVGSIIRQTGRLEELTRDLLDLARIDSGKSLFNKAPADPADVINAAIRDLEPQLAVKGISLVRNFESGLPSVAMDREKVIEVLVNLVGNAVKFSSPAGRITVSARTAGDGLTVTVADEGRGIETDDLPFIFQKFYRAKKEDPKYRGTGLGLAVSKGIIERHGGRIWAESAGPGKGSAFHFTLPLK
ncbi:MAG TPA: HAMP domain-containing sensor histidine kinase [Candidatus Omnitrophota bacterium]|nr:HAMP domain-containing sensor histidine kinase [Candidatus Omnitrophota bacterium]